MAPEPTPPMTLGNRRELETNRVRWLRHPPNRERFDGILDGHRSGGASNRPCRGLVSFNNPSPPMTLGKRREARARSLCAPLPVSSRSRLPLRP